MVCPTVFSKIKGKGGEPAAIQHLNTRWNGGLIPKPGAVLSGVYMFSLGL